MDKFRRYFLTYMTGSLLLALVACGSSGNENAQSEESTDGKGNGALQMITESIQKLTEVEIPEYEMADLGVSAEGYYYHHLDEEKQKAYRAILAGLLNRDEEFLLPVSVVNMDNVVEFRDYILLDHPEIFWFEGSCQTLQKGNEFTIKPDYTFSEEEIVSYQQKIEKEKQTAMDAIDAKISDESYARESDLRDYRIAKAVFEYVLDDVHYDKNSSNNQVLISALVNKMSVCEGISRMTQYLLHQYDIEATLVEGYHTENNEPHAWLMVKIGEEYYHMDPTFGNASFSQRDRMELADIPELRYHYAEFLMSDEIVKRSHTVTPCGQIALPACDSNAQNYFLLTGAYIPESAESADWNAHFLDTMRKGYTYWEVQFEDYRDYQECLEEVDSEYFDDELFYTIDMSLYSKEYYNYDDETYVIVWWLE